MRQTLRMAEGGGGPPLLRRRRATEPTTLEAVDQLRCRKTNSQRCILTEHRYSQRHPDILTATLGFQGLPLPRGSARVESRPCSSCPFATSGRAQLCTPVRSSE
jgi:hypothetical protein